METGKAGGLVILDGPDACGKTTLARHLLDGDDDGYIHLTYDSQWADPNRELFRLQYFSLLKAALRLDKGKLTVIDRHWMSEQVYARTYRAGSDLVAEARMMDRIVQRLCGVYIICTPAPESAVARHRATHQERTELYPPSKEIFEVATRFRQLYFGDASSPGRDYAEFLTQKGMIQREDAMLYDIDAAGHKFDDIRARARVRMNARQLTQYPPAFNYSKGNFLGHPRHAEFLFVGERINPNKTGRWPFVDYGASSKVLAGILQDLQFDETRGMWTNAYAEDEHAQTLKEWFPHLKVVAIGGEAICRMDELGIDCFKVVHPAYAQRFNKVEFLKTQLEEILR